MTEQELRPYLEELVKLDDEWNLSEWMNEFPEEERMMLNVLFAVKEYLKTNMSFEEHQQAIVDYLSTMREVGNG